MDRDGSLERLKQTRFFKFTQENLPGLLLAIFFLLTYLIFAESINFPGFRTLDQFFDTDISEWLARLTATHAPGCKHREGRSPRRPALFTPAGLVPLPIPERGQASGSLSDECPGRRSLCAAGLADRQTGLRQYNLFLDHGIAPGSQLLPSAVEFHA